MPVKYKAVSFFISFAVFILITDTTIHCRLKFARIMEIVNKNRQSTSAENSNNKQGRSNSYKRSNDENAVRLIGADRFEKLEKFFEKYRNSGKQANTVLLADLIHEIIQRHISTLVLPFGDAEYCSDFAQTQWCHLASLDLFIFPAVVEFGSYKADLSVEQYQSLKKITSVSIKGRGNVLLNIIVPAELDGNLTFYLYEYLNEVFVTSVKL